MTTKKSEVVVVVEDYDYESLQTNNVGAHMLAGAAAGILEHCVMYPIDSVKTRMQILTPDPRARYKGMLDAFRIISKDESFWATMRGIDVTAYGSGPAHAVYFACYEYIKHYLRRKDESNHLAHAIAGVGATIAHDLVYNPFEVIKQRMQVFGSPYKNWWTCANTVFKTEGWGAFYRSFGTQLLMNAPYQSLHFVVYEFAQDKLNQDREYKPLSHVISGGSAGAVAAAATTPFDVMKTLLNTHKQQLYMSEINNNNINSVNNNTANYQNINYTRCNDSKNEKGLHANSSKPGPNNNINIVPSSVQTPNNPKRIKGIIGAAREVYQLGGFRGFFAGTVPRVFYQIPSTAIAWSTYEFFKFIIVSHDTDP
ncbi:hypothetical protein HELRODRAFT_185413 [Helobdella robusta]|uniref:Mitoferrin-1 n=1 Tax=Helobdella robusta TaxID=6412 RepID=T1FMS4_HELRO|nr:hypothetical protein HELRODRAFT_185413 [Helobdella robusta]ESO08024.1 hypothetical protein HELRODRAFT_185413 [Helobdella robusta]